MRLWQETLTVIVNLNSSTLSELTDKRFAEQPRLIPQLHEQVLWFIHLQWYTHVPNRICNQMNTVLSMLSKILVLNIPNIICNQMNTVLSMLSKILVLNILYRISNQMNTGLSMLSKILVLNMEQRKVMEVYI